MPYKKYKKIHFIGIGGIGVSAVAKWALLEGVEVSGSDVENTEITSELQKMGAKIFIGHKEKNIARDIDLIVYSSAVPATNPERSVLRRIRHSKSLPLEKEGQDGFNNDLIPQKSYFEFLGEITRGKKLIAVSGTNGKSTTTAMLGKILIDAGLDPLVIVGSKINVFSHGNFNYGKGEYAVVEACEHNAHMLNLHPWSIVLTNIEADHLDFYKNLDNILEAFKKYVAKIEKGCFLIYNGDDKNSAEVAKTHACRLISYGVHEDADLRFEERHIDKGTQIFQTKTVGLPKPYQMELQVPGLFNVYNAMAAISMAKALGIKFEVIKKSLANFRGLWRRFEHVGEYNGAPIISDYGHHPHAIEATLLAAREFYPDRRVILAYEPHQHHRTKALFADFVRSFDKADVLILGEIYNVEGRVEKQDCDISSRKLADAIIKYWESDENKKERTEHELFYCENNDEVLKALKETINSDDVVIIMGAGGIYKVAKRLIAADS
ncbi:UDP-N-acetylmuramate--L-alanine ligase [Candidatus Parcubacteria bacterium]|nr:UDP-N-acetylmuramate--L-alanine ligase [Patescibacteria group bacterium]MCG2693908.1 UDP-N-acetylmuramate--L-alanine ligase [Candidatus Parcubacteria bacterium]